MTKKETGKKNTLPGININVYPKLQEREHAQLPFPFNLSHVVDRFSSAVDVRGGSHMHLPALTNEAPPKSGSERAPFVVNEDIKYTMVTIPERHNIIEASQDIRSHTAVVDEVGRYSKGGKVSHGEKARKIRGRARFSVFSLSRITLFSIALLGCILLVGFLSRASERESYSINFVVKPYSHEYFRVNDGSLRERATFNILNTNEEAVILSFTTENWDPAEASNHFQVSWDYEDTPIEPGKDVDITFTLSESSAGAINDFSFDIIFIANPSNQS